MPNVATIDAKLPITGNADEHTRAGDLGCIERDRRLLEGRKRRFDLRQPGIDFFWHLIRLLVGRL